MRDRKNLVAVGSDDSKAPEQAATSIGEGEIVISEEDEASLAGAWEEAEFQPERSREWILPALALLVVAGWTGFFIWAHRAEMLPGGTPVQWSGWIVDWAVPVLLVVGLWLLAMRHSRREASRFADAAQRLSQESGLLEHRLVTVNRELSLARDFIAAQSRDLESLGRVAVDRLSENADRLQGLIHDNHEQVETIGRVSTAAVTNMDRLRDGLPVISNSARDVANQIGQVGQTARDQLSGMIEGFNRLNEFGEASTRTVDILRGRVDEAVGAFEAQALQLDEIAASRFSALAERSAAFRTELDGREVDALAAVRRRADALEEELSLRARQMQEQQDTAIASLRQNMELLRDEGASALNALREGEREAAGKWIAAISALEERMAQALGNIAAIDEGAAENARNRLLALSSDTEQLDRAIVERHSLIDDELERRRLAAMERERAEMVALQERIANLDAQIAGRQETHLAHVSSLSERGEALAQRMDDLGAALQQLAQQGQQNSERLASAGEDLARRLEHSLALIQDSGTNVARLTDDSVRLLELIRAGVDHTRADMPEAIAEASRKLSAIEARAMALSELVGEAAGRGEALASHVDAARRDGAMNLEQLRTLEERVLNLAQQSTALASQARGELDEAMNVLEHSSAEIFSRLESEHAGAVRSLAERIGAEGSGAIEQALRRHSAEAIADLEAAALNAGEAGREAALQLRHQLAKINELTSNLEGRVAYARERAEEQVDHDFARRMALITESLNSATIDITKAFDNEVADTAWASYLRGDRGIFTRRAVRLLDNHDARAISEIYQQDSEFRETVNRYIHDFEAMLRSVLSTRDGNPLGVTMLSSDIGKLYVALAQAIDRLRN